MQVRNSSLFSQLLGVIDRSVFGRLVRETGAEKGAKGFSCWEQLVGMLFCQLAHARSLREISGGLQCCEGKLKHLGVEKAPGRSTLSYANAHRPWRLFEKLFHHLLEACRMVAPGKKFRFKNKLLSLDATVIETLRFHVRLGAVSADQGGGEIASTARSRWLLAHLCAGD